MSTMMNGSSVDHDILLLAERMRVEERLLIAAFAAEGRNARIITPAEVSLTVGQRSFSGQLVVVRLLAGREASTLSLLLDDAGATVVNQPALTARLEDRARLLHWLSDTGFTTLPATVAFGEDSLLSAADAIGYPVVLSPLDAGQQSIIVHDRETAEAVVEHRAVLGGERALVVRPAISSVELRRVVVAGEDTFAASAIGDWPIRDETAWQPVAVNESDIQLADGLRQLLGSGAYHADCIAGTPATVLKVRLLSSFRVFQNDGHDVAGAIVRHALATQAEVANVTAA